MPTCLFSYGIPTGRWSRLALQAKKLYADDRYLMLNRVKESESQLNSNIQDTADEERHGPNP